MSLAVVIVRFATLFRRHRPPVLLLASPLLLILAPFHALALNATGPPQNEASAPAVPVKKTSPVRLFGTVEFRSPIKNLPKWERVRDAESKEPSFVPNGMAVKNSSVSERWKRLRDKLKGAPLMEQAKGVNAFFNQWPYKIDLDVWGVEDYWARPSEFVQRSGDCEDYAIAKYYALRDLGVPPEVLRVAAVRDTVRNLGHAVAIVYHDGDAFVLDNLLTPTLSHTKLPHYKVIFSVNEKFLWKHVQPKSSPK